MAIHPVTDLSEFCEVVVDDITTIDRSEWLALRRTGLGGSDAAASMGLSPYKSPVALYLDKIDEVPDVDKEIFEAGRRAEPMIRSWFRDRTGLTVEPCHTMMRSKQWNWMLANIDGLVIDDQGELAILECKTSAKESDWKDGPSLYARIQGQHYLAVTGLNRLYIAVLIKGNHFVHFSIDRDEELIADMIRAEERFWTMVQMQRMPDVDGSESTREALRRHYAEPTRAEIEVGDEFLELLNKREIMKQMISHYEIELNEVESQMIVLTQGAEIMSHRGEILATWKISTRKPYTVEASSSRRWHIPKGDK